MLADEIKALFSWYPEVIRGFTRIDYSPYAAEYASALVFAVPYGEQLTPETYTEERFDNGIQTAKAKLETIIAALEEILQRDQVKYWVPPVAQRNETELLAPFSFKFAAVNAGIGWIGKNDVVITEQYGPRVRLSAVLIDAPFDYRQPVTQSRCPEDCTLCIDACPCKALTGQRWTIDSHRSKIIDYHRCNRYRSAYIPKLGRKNACGLCMAACPIGQPKETVS